MEGYTCIKSCNFGGVAYNEGDPIPSKAVLPSREGVLISQKIIAKVNETAELTEGTNKVEKAAYGIDIPISTRNGWNSLRMTQEGIKKAIAVLQQTADDATKEITKIEDEAALTLIDILDTRKSVKTAAESKLGKIKGDA